MNLEIKRWEKKQQRLKVQTPYDFWQRNRGGNRVHLSFSITDIMKHLHFLSRPQISVCPQSLQRRRNPRNWQGEQHCENPINGGTPRRNRRKSSVGNAVCSCYPCCPFKTEIKPFLLAVPRSPVSVESRKVEKYVPNMFSSFLRHPTYFTTTKKVKDGKSTHTAQFIHEKTWSAKENTTTICWQIWACRVWGEQAVQLIFIC